MKYEAPSLSVVVAEVDGMSFVALGGHIEDTAVILNGPKIGKITMIEQVDQETKETQRVPQMTMVSLSTMIVPMRRIGHAGFIKRNDMDKSMREVFDILTKESSTLLS